VSKQVREYMKRRKEVVSRRGTVHGLGRALTQKRIIVRLYHNRCHTPEISMKTKHTENACDRCIKTFKNVHMLADRNINTEEISNTLEMCYYPVKKCINLDGKFKRDGGHQFHGYTLESQIVLMMEGGHAKDYNIS